MFAWFGRVVLNRAEDVRRAREIATALGLSVYQYEKRHARAWSALVHIVAVDGPIPRCRPVRRSRTHVEADLLECLNCRLALSSAA